MELILQPLTQNLLDEVLKVENDAFSHPWSYQQFLGELSSNATRYFVAIANQQVVGYAGCWLIVDEVHITNIAVLRDFQRMGIGNRLLAHLEEQTAAEGANYYTLEVRRSNIAAQTLYRQHGFSVAGVRKNYYQDEDALIMIKEI